MPECSNCSALQGQVGALRGQVAALQNQVNRLTNTVNLLAGGVMSTVGWIETEIRKPTMQRPKVLPYLFERLRDVLESIR